MGWSGGPDAGERTGEAGTATRMQWQSTSANRPERTAAWKSWRLSESCSPSSNSCTVVSALPVGTEIGHHQNALSTALHRDASNVPHLVISAASSVRLSDPAVSGSPPHEPLQSESSRANIASTALHVIPQGVKRIILISEQAWLGFSAFFGRSDRGRECRGRTAQPPLRQMWRPVWRTHRATLLPRWTLHCTQAWRGEDAF